MLFTMENPFPTDPREFDSDNRISFSRLDNKFIAVRDDGSEYEFDADTKSWILADDEPLEPGAEDDYGQDPSNSTEVEGSNKRKIGSAHGSEVRCFPCAKRCCLLRRANANYFLLRTPKRNLRVLIRSKKHLPSQDRTRPYTLPDSQPTPPLRKYTLCSPVKEA